MKLILIVVAIFAVSLGSASPATYGLKEDLDDFVKLIPKTQILKILVDYLGNDPEVQEVMDYILSNDFKQLILDIEAISEYREFLKYLQNNGLNVYYYIQQLHDFLGLPIFEPKFISNKQKRGTGLRGMLDEIESILPVQEIEKLYNDKLENSPAFKNLIDVMRGDDMKSVIEQLKENKKFQELVKKAGEHGVDIELIKEILQKIFGWSR